MTAQVHLTVAEAVSLFNKLCTPGPRAAILPSVSPSPTFPHLLLGARRCPLTRQGSELVRQHQAGKQNIQVIHPGHSQDTYSYNLGDSSAAGGEEGGQKPCLDASNKRGPVASKRHPQARRERPSAAKHTRTPFARSRTHASSRATRDPGTGE